MSVVLTILKIIGIILLILLALVILLASLILFVPVRYQLQLQVDGEVDAKATVSYLLHFVHLTLAYNEKKPHGKLRILGIPVYDFFPSDEVKQKREERKKRKEEKQRKKLQKQKEKQRKKRDKTKKVNQKKVKRKTTSQSQQQVQKKTETTQNKLSEKKNSEAKPSEKSVSSIKQTQLEIRMEKIPEEKTEEEQETKTGKLTELWDKIKNTYRKVKVFLQKVVDKVKNFKYTIIEFYKKLKHAKETILWYVEVLSREESKRAIQKAKHQLGRLWKHVSPKTFQGSIQFGFDDPATTGDVFSKICMIYPLYASYIVIVPDFEKSVLKGDLFLKGRIRVVTLLHIGWKIMFDKEIRKLYEICSNPESHR